VRASQAPAASGHSLRQCRDRYYRQTAWRIPARDTPARAAAHRRPPRRDVHGLRRSHHAPGYPPPRSARGRVGPPRRGPAPGAPDDLASPPRPGVRARRVKAGRPASRPMWLSWHS